MTVVGELALDEDPGLSLLDEVEEEDVLSLDDVEEPVLDDVPELVWVAATRCEALAVDCAPIEPVA